MARKKAPEFLPDPIWQLKDIEPEKKYDIMIGGWAVYKQVSGKFILSRDAKIQQIWVDARIIFEVNNISHI